MARLEAGDSRVALANVHTDRGKVTNVEDYNFGLTFRRIEVLECRTWIDRVICGQPWMWWGLMLTCINGPAGSIELGRAGELILADTSTTQRWIRSTRVPCLINLNCRVYTWEGDECILIFPSNGMESTLPPGNPKPYAHCPRDFFKLKSRRSRRIFQIPGIKSQITTRLRGASPP